MLANFGGHSQHTYTYIKLKQILKLRPVLSMDSACSLSLSIHCVSSVLHGKNPLPLLTFSWPRLNYHTSGCYLLQESHQGCQRDDFLSPKHWSRYRLYLRDPAVHPVHLISCLSYREKHSLIFDNIVFYQLFLKNTWL